MKRPVGWYLLPRSGVPYFGTVPDGALTLREQTVDGVDGGPEVGADVLLDEQASEPEQLLDGPVDGTTTENDGDSESQVVGHGEEA